MGTSGSSSGSDSNTPLVPSWLDEPDDSLLPGGGLPLPPEKTDDDDKQHDSDKPEDTNNDKPDPERFKDSRTNFSRFAGSGGENKTALKRAVGDYVRSGTGGSGNAVQRMGISRRSGSNALGVFRGIQRDGLRETLRQLDLESLSGKSISDMFLGLTEVVCQDGGSIDEAIARDAWLETIAELDRFGLESIDGLTTDQVQEIFLSFIAHSVEARLYQEIGVNGFKYADSLEDIESFDLQFRDYIGRTVRDSFRGDLRKLSSMTDNEIKKIVDKTYFDAWSLLELLGESEG